MPSESWPLFSKMVERRRFGLYVHWPFCQAKCPYCDFNSHVSANIDQERWRSCFQSEIKRAREFSGPRILDSIFFGGGTPSLMEPATVSAVIDAARDAWSSSNDMEITLEANPTSVEAGRFRDYASVGVNRVSIGVQSFRDDALKALGRLHSAKEAKDAVDLARQHFSRVSFDLIYARQDQSLDDWRLELGEALDFAADHLSLYQLTIEPDTAFGERFKRGRLGGLPDEDLGADMFELTQDMTAKAGLPAYEISNHAAPGAESRHNLIYWKAGDWVGVGPGAHGRVTTDAGRFATESHSAPGQWIQSVERLGSGQSVCDLLPKADILGEAIMMGLRLAEGIPETLFDDSLKINNLVDLGMLARHEKNVRTTARGRPVLNAILREILA